MLLTSIGSHGQRLQRKPATFITYFGRWLLCTQLVPVCSFRVLEKKNSEAIVGPFVEQRSGILPRIVLGAEGEVLSLRLSRGGEVLSLSLQEISS